MVAISARGAKKLQDELENYALSMPEAWFDTPWDDERVTKVRKKIFAIYGNQDRPSIGVGCAAHQAGNARPLHSAETHRTRLGAAHQLSTAAG